MWWECSECGCRVRKQRRPRRCPECGLAGLMFKEVGSDTSWEPGGGGLRDYWLEYGMSFLRRPTFEPTVSSET